MKKKLFSQYGYCVARTVGNDKHLLQPFYASADLPLAIFHAKHKNRQRGCMGSFRVLKVRVSEVKR